MIMYFMNRDGIIYVVNAKQKFKCFVDLAYQARCMRCDNCAILATLNVPQSITVTLYKCAVEEQKTFLPCPSLYLTPKKKWKIIMIWTNSTFI